MAQVGIRELKANLSRYLREVQRGKCVYVTDRGEVIAQITTVDDPSTSKTPAATTVAALACASCAGMTPTQQRALSGGAMGAAGGAVIGAIAGNAGMGAAIGAGAGVLGGLAVDQHEQAKQRAYDQGYQDAQRRR